MRRPVRNPGIQHTSRPDPGDYPSGAAVRLCGYSSRIVSLLGMGVHSPLLNMLPLRIPTWVPQDSVYLVTNPSVTHSRMPRPRYSSREERTIERSLYIILLLYLQCYLLEIG